MKVILYNCENPMEVAQAQAATRILYVITKSNWGGAQRYVYDLATAAKEHGFEVAVASGREGELTDRLREANVAVFPIPSLQRDVRLTSDVKVLGELMRIISDFKPDIVHGNSSKAGALVAFAARLKGVHRIVFTAHAWAFNESRPLWQKVIIGMVHYLTVLLSHTTICNSEATKRDVRWMPFVQKRLVVIHHGVRAFSMHSQAEARAALPVDTTARTWIGTIAELHPSKGLDTLIQAFEHVLPDYHDAALVIIGEGEERGYLEHLVKVDGLNGRVYFSGHITNAPSHLPAFDLFVLPSRAESLGYVLLEAGMASLPAIGTSVGGIPEIIVANETGLIVPPNDPAALTEAIERMLGNLDLRTRLSGALHEKVLRDFTPERMFDATFSVYQPR